MSKQVTTSETCNPVTKYSLDAGIESMRATGKLSEAQKKKIANLEEKLSEISSARSSILDIINKDKELSKSERILAIANIEADYVERKENIEKKIHEINPNWIENASAAIKAAIDKAGDLSEAGLETSRAAVGSTIKPAISAAKSFFRGIKNALK